MSDDGFTVPSTPDPQLTALVAMLLRYVFAGLSTLGLYHGATDGSMLSLLAGVLVGGATVIWAIVERIKTARKIHATAVASAAAKQPVQPAP